MRSLDSARDSWQELKRYHSLSELKEAARLDGHTSACSAGLRSACWKAFLLFDTLETPQWPRTLQSSRSAYNSLRMHFMRDVENADDLEANFDPLNEQKDVRTLTRHLGFQSNLTIAKPSEVSMAVLAEG